MRALSEIIHTAKRRGLGFIRDLFYIPKHGKLPEVTFLGRIALSVTVIIGCLGAMGLSAYAYFRTNEVAAFGTLRSADYSLEILVNNEPLTDGRLQGKAEETYEVALRKGGAAQTGFCVITVRQEGAEDVTAYHTQQIGKDKKVDGEWTEQITFTVQFNGDATLTFEPHWGTSSNYPYVGYEAFEQEPQPNSYIVDKEILTVAANAPQSTPSEKTETPDSTPSTTTVTTTVTAATTSTTVATDDVSESTTASSSSTSASTASAGETTAKTSAQTEETEETTSTTSVTEEITAETTVMGEVITSPDEEN